MLIVAPIFAPIPANIPPTLVKIVFPTTDQVASTPNFEAIAFTITFDAFSPNHFLNFSENRSFFIPLIVMTPRIIETVSRSSSPRKSVIPFNTFSHFIFFIAVVRVVHIPCTHVFTVFPNAAKSNVLKNLFIPVAIEFPKFFQLNVVPNESAA